MDIDFQDKIKLLKKIDSMVCFDPKKAITIINGYLKKHSDDIEINLMKAHLYDSISEFNKAFDIYNYVLEIDSSNIQALIDLGDHYFNCKSDYMTAFKHYDNALKLLLVPCNCGNQDEFIAACIGKANSLVELDRISDAQSVIEQGLQTYPNDIVLLSVLQKIEGNVRT